MLLTEDEAKTKWCPHVRHPDEVGGTFNRGRVEPLNDHEHNDGTLCNCIASACMAWRWADLLHAGTVVKEGRPIAAMKGFCGLAGNP